MKKNHLNIFQIGNVLPFYCFLNHLIWFLDLGSQFPGPVCRPMHITLLCKTFYFAICVNLAIYRLKSLMTTRELNPFHFTATDQFQIAYYGIQDSEQIFKNHFIAFFTPKYTEKQITKQ